MFQKSSNSKQLDIFSSSYSVLPEKISSQLSAKDKWHNIFREVVTHKIDEQLFSVLYSDGQGAPNSSIGVMVAMMVLKEGEGISDAKLFENCHFNLLFRSALGLFNLGDKVPAESTYYLFRKKIKEYEQQTGVQLLDESFKHITRQQCLEFHVSGKSIRMDSKLIGSNIQWFSRFGLIHNTLGMYLKKRLKNGVIPSDLHEELSAFLSEKSEEIEYRHSSEEIKDRLVPLGILIQKVLAHFSGDQSVEYQTLCRVFDEQYQLDDQDLKPKKSDQISAQSVQSPYDPDAHYRNKAGQTIKGYSINLTETNSEGNPLDLVTSLETKTATAADNDYLVPGIEDTEQVTDDTVEEVNADGAYNSDDNQQYCKENDKKLHLHAIQGQKSRYEFPLSQNGEVQIWDTKLNKMIDYQQITTKNGDIKLRISSGGKYRYFTTKEIQTYRLRETIKNTPIEILQRRNNVEATIFQLAYHYRANKTRYRGLIKHKMWAINRALWINCVRIVNYKAKNAFINQLKSFFIRLNAKFSPVYAFFSNTYNLYGRWGNYAMSKF